MDYKYIMRKDLSRFINNNLVCRIQAVKDFNDVKTGDIGGYIESESNLSHAGECWIYDNSVVYQKAKVVDNATVSGNQVIKGDAYIGENVCIGAGVIISPNAILRGRVQIGNGLNGR